MEAAVLFINRNNLLQALKYFV